MRNFGCGSRMCTELPIHDGNAQCTHQLPQLIEEIVRIGFFRRVDVRTDQQGALDHFYHVA